MRLIDKCPVSAAQGYLLDTYPKDSLRLITRWGVRHRTRQLRQLVDGVREPRWHTL